MFFGKVKKWYGTLTGKVEQCQQTITFAEANLTDMVAGECQAEPEETLPPKLLVAGNESVFSEDIMSYSLDMAKRMSYEIVALNAAPLSCQTFRLFSESRQKLCDDFKEMAEKSAEVFRERAVAAGIPFTHIVKFDEMETAVSEVMKSEPYIDFVISDTAESAENRVQEENRPQNQIFIYSMNIN